MLDSEGLSFSFILHACKEQCKAMHINKAERFNKVFILFCCPEVLKADRFLDKPGNKKEREPLLIPPQKVPPSTRHDRKQQRIHAHTGASPDYFSVSIKFGGFSEEEMKISNAISYYAICLVIFIS